MKIRNKKYTSDTKSYEYNPDDVFSKLYLSQVHFISMHTCKRLDCSAELLPPGGSVVLYKERPSRCISTHKPHLHHLHKFSPMSVLVIPFSLILLFRVRMVSQVSRETWVLKVTG